MRKNYSYIYLVLIILLAFQSASGQTETADQTAQNVLVQQSDSRIENLMKQAKELFEAYDNQNFDKLAALTHPKVYEEDGLKGLFEEFDYAISHRLETYELLPSTVENPGELIEIENQIFVVVPYKLNGIDKAEKDKTVHLGSMVGISEDGGKSWKFAKGAAFNKVFLNIAAMIPIPNPMEKRLVDGLEK